VTKEKGAPERGAGAPQRGDATVEAHRGPRVELGALRPLRGRTCRKRQALLRPPRYAPVRRPFGLPCVTRPVRRLRNSAFGLRQSSPKPPDWSALLGGAQGTYAIGWDI